MKYAIVTFGCRVNQADSLQIEARLRAAGGAPAPPEAATVVVVNTCSVTATADQGARQTIRRLARLNPAARVVVTGCYATRDPDALADLPSVAQVVGNQDKDRVAPVVADLLGLTTAERFGSGNGACGAALEPGAAGRTAYTLCVQTGCDEACSYCVIPRTRGHGRSLGVTEVVAAAQRATDAGFREVILTGVHLGSYGRDLPVPRTLTDLLRALDSGVAGDALFRISSLEPLECPEDLVKMVASNSRFAPHFHLPLQHASDAVLAAMRRPYTLAYYRDLVGGIRERLPHAAIGSDVIVGFPGETDSDVERLSDFLAGSPLTHLHVFPYSDRPGTEASRLHGRVAGAVVRQRAALVRSIGHDLWRRFRERQVQTVRRALTLQDGRLAVTDNFLKVRLAPGRQRNEWVQVRITDAGDPAFGEVVADALTG